MDGITEQFSVYDYFNSVIGGIVFLIGIGCFTYPGSKDKLIEIASTIGESTFLLIMAIILFVAVASVIGSAINAVGSYVFKKWVKWESKYVGTCLIDDEVVGNKIKFDSYKTRAENYFESLNRLNDNKGKMTDDKNDNKVNNNTNFSDEQCSCFYAHCVYYNQIRSQNTKTERLRDVMGLSCVLASVFVVLAVIGGISSLCGSNNCWLTLIFVLFAVIFILKYKYDVQCRVRMVLAVYDVTVEKEKAEHKHKGAI